ncbi:hypothetical protein SANTM175S_00023 [Streptomyces antimycoticus]
MTSIAGDSAALVLRTYSTPSGTFGSSRIMADAWGSGRSATSKAPGVAKMPVRSLPVGSVRGFTLVAEWGIVHSFFLRRSGSPLSR